VDDGAALNPAQVRVLTELMDLGGDRPAFDPSLADDLGAFLEQGLAPVAARLGDDAVVVDKGKLARVHQCERFHLAEEQAGFAWSSRNACGTVAHKAIELALFARSLPAPLDAVDRALERIAETAEDWGPARFLARSDESERAELRSAANDAVHRFFQCFPSLSPRWCPVVESRARVDLCGGLVVLKGRVDLSLGRPDGHTARVLLVDLKTGAPHPSHAHDLRYYALLEALRSGVPPFRVASYYLESARWHAEDVTAELLESAARRVVHGVAKLVELSVERRPPTINPGPACGYCPDRTACEGATRWAEERASRGLVPVA
jgi:hypothetical protein